MSPSSPDRLRRILTLAARLERESAELGRDGMYGHAQHVLNLAADALREGVMFEENVEAIADGRVAMDRPLHPEGSWR